MNRFALRQVLLRAADPGLTARTQSALTDAPIAFQDGERYIALERLPLTVAVVADSEARYPVTLAYRVDDVDSAVAELLAKGYTVIEAAADGAHERHALLLDPNGVPTSLYSPKAQP